MFRIFLFVLLCVLIKAQGTARVSLTGDDWTITDEKKYTVQGTIPGSIHTILLAAKKIPDPYVGTNDVDLRNLVKTNWVFSKTFNLSNDIRSAEEIYLILEQIDTVANVTINKCPIGRTNSMFIRYILEIPNACLHSTNEIFFHFESPITYAYNRSIEYNSTVEPICTPPVQKGECHVQFIRKEPCSFSWDWGPAFAPIGITRDIYIEASNYTDADLLLESVNVVSFNSTNKLWNVNVRFTSTIQFKGTLKFVLVNTTWSSEVPIIFAVSTTVTLSIPEKYVARWWPNGYGNQALYELTVSIGDRLIDARVLGFRTVELVQDHYDRGINGTSFYFVINSVPVFVKGSNWIPPDSFQERVSDEKLERLLSSAQAANMNMLRVWGGGYYERRSFYQLADRLGIMLWHDFMFACSLYPVDQPFLDNVYEEVLYQVRRLQHHPSIVLWSGNNENEEAIAHNWWSLSTEQLEQAKRDYRTLYIQTVQTAVKEVDTGSNRPFVPSSPSNGPLTIQQNYIADNPQDPLYGDVHFYGFTSDPWNYTTYPITRFLSETGVQSLPSLDTWQEATNKQSDLSFNSSFVQHREHSENTLNGLWNAIELNLPLPATKDPLKRFSQLIYLSQIHQSMTLKSISDLCRLSSSKDKINPKTSEGHTMGLMYWQINDIWQGPTWSTIEYNGKWKMSHYYARHMYTPIYVVTSLSPYLADIHDQTAKISVTVINENLNGTQGVLVCGLYNLKSFDPQLMFAGEISMNSSGQQTIANYEYSSLMNRAECISSSLCLLHCSYESGKLFVRQTLFLTRPKNYVTFDPNLQIHNLTKISPNDFTFVLTAERPALFVWLDIPSNIAGYFSRNGFHMFQHSIIISFHSWTPIDTLPLRPTFSLFDITQP